MSLRVWLPLMGDLKNNGLDVTDVSGTNLTIDNNGKIGPCYAFDGTSRYITIENAPLNNDTEEFSFACWFKATADDELMCLYANRSGTVSTGFTIFLYGSNNTLLFDTGARLQVAMPPEITLNEWHHLVFTWRRSNGEKAVWVDGVRAISGTQTTLPTKADTESAYIGTSQTLTSGYLKGCLNDVRIYDHVLSTAEIKELAKGLVCHYKLDDKEETIIDSSGYRHHGLAVNSPTVMNTPRRYSTATMFNGSNQYIRCYRGAMIKDELTLNLWAYMETWGLDGSALISCTQSGGWAIGTNSQKIAYWVGTGESSNTYLRPFSSMLFSDLSSGWHMFTLTYDGHTAKSYVDTVLQASEGSYETKTPIFYNVSNGIFIAAEAVGNQTTPGGSYFPGSISDVRIYATALSEADIQALYETNASVSNPDVMSAYEYKEGEDTSIINSGVVSCGEISEFGIAGYVKYDTNTYIEPDGSCWVRLFHHNDPSTNGYFGKTDVFTNSLYLSEHKWFNMDACNYANKWEIMVKQKALSTDNIICYRWIQNTNPMTATYEDISGNVTKISDGYDTMTFDGIYLKGNTSTYLCQATNTSTQWYGAVGCMKANTSGIPKFDRGDDITTGYMDVYLRIDNLTSSDPSCVKFAKSGSIIAKQFKEE